jgi:restriction endonuclease
LKQKWIEKYTFRQNLKISIWTDVLSHVIDFNRYVYQEGAVVMNLDNVFYFKRIVDQYYPDENRSPVDTKAVIDVVQEDIKHLNNDDFSEVIISCFIPDLYSGMGKCEKLFTKLTELMVGEWWRRMGGEYRLPTKKSGTEDVELKYNNISIVCDAKVFRLGRSQKAPNVKDFLKLASVVLWIKNLKKNGSNHVIGGLVTYSSLHEWEKDSEVYEECTNHDTPVVMLPYEVMALLLRYKCRVKIPEMLNLWNYRENSVITSRSKQNYWGYITRFICNLLSITESEFKGEMKAYHRLILNSVAEYRRIVQNTVDAVVAAVSADLNRFDEINQLKHYAINEIVKRDNATALDYLKHIDDFRYYHDQ